MNEQYIIRNLTVVDEDGTVTAENVELSTSAKNVYFNDKQEERDLDSILFGDKTVSALGTDNNFYDLIQDAIDKEVKITMVSPIDIEKKILQDYNNENTADSAVLTYQGFKTMRDLESSDAQSFTKLTVAKGSATQTGVPGIPIKEISIQDSSVLFTCGDQNIAYFNETVLRAFNSAVDNGNGQLYGGFYFNKTYQHIRFGDKSTIQNYKNQVNTCLDAKTNYILTFIANKEDVGEIFQSSAEKDNAILTDDKVLYLYYIDKETKEIIFIPFNYISDISIGANAAVFGYKNKSVGDNSFSSGFNNIAEGINAFTMGENNCVYGRNSVAFGDNQSINGLNSVAMGTLNTINANSSCVFGSSNTLFKEGVESYIRGKNNTNTSPRVYIDGINNDIRERSDDSHIRGQNNSIFHTIYSQIQGNNNQVTVQENNVANFVYVQGSDNVLEDVNHVYVNGYNNTIKKATYTHVEGLEHDVDAAILSGHIEGKGCQLVAEGEQRADYAHVEGRSSIAKSYASHAEGRACVAQGQGSHAEGFITYAGESGPSTFESFSIGYGYHTEGYNTRAYNGGGSHAEGIFTLVEGFGSHGEGRECKVEESEIANGGGIRKISSTGAHVEGYQCTVQGDGAHAEGYGCKAYEMGSHAEGFQTIAGSLGAPGDVWGAGYAHAEGQGTKALAYASHAGGQLSTVDRYAEASFVHGRGLISNNKQQFIIGTWNDASPTRYNATIVFAIGNGTEQRDGFGNPIGQAEKRSNLFEIWSDGAIFVNVNGTMKQLTIN